MRFRAVFFFIATLFISTFSVRAQDDIIQVTGVIMTADSLHKVPDASVVIKGKDLGTYSNARGIFSLVCNKGDVLRFEQMGYETVEFKVPENTPGKFISIVQLMTQDTFYLPETIINPYWDREDIMYTLKNEPVPEDAYAAMADNTNPATMAAIRAALPRQGAENQAAYQYQQAYKATYAGQQAPIGLFNVMAWNDFFKAWKRGDFKRKKTQ